MMRRLGVLVCVLLAGFAPAALGQQEGGLDVELWTDRGHDAVYQPGDDMELHVRASDDGYLLLYEIDAEGAVRLLWPIEAGSGFVEGGRTLSLPAERSQFELVVEGPVGQGYVVALLSERPFLDLPWYLRPEDEGWDDGEILGAEEEGVTEEGRIVGDPFVAMERIRRRVLEDPEDLRSFGTAYTTYHVEHRVRYPRYLCNDCHRPNQWAWWDGFDPYYATCSVFDFRVNYSWYWGPGYWFSQVPYYYFVYRADCPPRYRLYSSRYTYHSSWDGWRRWTSLWAGSLTRYKSPPPDGYVPPSKYKERWPKERPPGFASDRSIPRGRGEQVGRPLAERRNPTRSGDARDRLLGSRMKPRNPEGRLRTLTPRDSENRRRESETRGSIRGMADGRRGGLRWVERGRAGSAPGMRREVMRTLPRERDDDSRRRTPQREDGPRVERRRQERRPPLELRRPEHREVGRQLERPRHERQSHQESRRFEPRRREEPRHVERPRFEPRRREEPRQVERPRFESRRREEPRHVERPRFEPRRREEPRQLERPRSEERRNEEPRQVERPRDASRGRPDHGGGRGRRGGR